MEKLKITRILLTVFFVLVVAGLDGKVVSLSIKFMNCEWGISPEEAISALKQELINIEFTESRNLSYTDRARGIRLFEPEAFQFADYKWSLKLKFLDNKLVEVILISSNVDESRILNELEAKFGKHEIHSITKDKIWKAEDGSKLYLVTWGKKTFIMYQAPHFS